MVQRVSTVAFEGIEARARGRAGAGGARPACLQDIVDN